MKELINCKKELVNYKTAVLAKEKGFCHFSQEEIDEYVCVVNEKYNEDGELEEGGFVVGGNVVEAPTQSFLQRWLREKHGIYIELIIDGWGDNTRVSNEHLGYRAFVWQVGKPKPHHNDDLGMSTHENILEIALQHGLKLINK